MGAASIIEQRWSQRRGLSLDIEVFEHGTFLSMAKSQNVGLGGVFIELDDGVSKLMQDQELILYFSLGNEGSTKYKLKAKVVRVSPKGTGLMFKDFDTNSFRALQEIMRNADSTVLAN